MSRQGAQIRLGREGSAPAPPKAIRRLAGVEAAEAALAAGDLRLLLVDVESRDARLARLVEQARDAGVRVRTATPRVLERLMQRTPGEPGVPDVLGLVGRDPDADLPALLARRGALWLLVGVAYPGNVGMVIRTAEVSGADGVVVEPAFDHTGKRAALRASMRADRFMPVLWESPERLLEAARHTGHRLLALDDAGSHAPWDLDLRGPCIFVVGAENGGIPADLLARCDARIRVPMAGFIPCYNLQAAVSAVAVERLRQTYDRR
jgi:tRNA G18 (ribose-2'-O)-methylase SpoU